MAPDTRVVVPAFVLGTMVSEALALALLVLEAWGLVLEATALEEPVEEPVEVADPSPPGVVLREVLELVLVAVDRVVGVSVLEALEVLVVFSVVEVVVEAASVVVAEEVDVAVGLVGKLVAPATTKRGR